MDDADRSDDDVLVVLGEGIFRAFEAAWAFEHVNFRGTQHQTGGRRKFGQYGHGRVLARVSRHEND
jgi:hypothetical protein